MSLAGDIIPLVNAQLAASRPDVERVYLGAEFLAQDEAPPRIIWVPTVDTMEFGKRRSNGLPAIVAGTPAVPIPRSIGTRRAGCNVHIWGADFNSTEILLDAVVTACRYVGYGSFAVTKGMWIGGSSGEQFSQFGRAYVMSLVWEVPILDLQDASQTTVVTITHVDQNTGMTFPDDTTVSGDPAPT